MKRILFYGFLILILLVAASGFWAYQQYQAFLNTPVNLSESSQFELPAGSSIRRVSRDLRQQGILQDREPLQADWLFHLHARLTQQASKIKAGEFVLEPGMKPDDVLQRFVSGKTLQYQISFVEGRRFTDIVATVKANPDLQHTLSDDDYANLMTKLGAPEGMQPEGWFFPDTYHFPRNTTDFEVLKRSYDTMVAYLTTAWEQREPSAFLQTPYEALILASIVEKETGVPDERPLIAGVFMNRLAKDMLLQTDPTVIYGMGERYQGNIRKKDLRTDTPYNTYTRKGLTPTPIATPSKAAIDAVMHPDETEAFYFVATGLGDGRHYFSKTYAEHRRAVIKYQLNGRSSRYQGDK